jgi:hypothetical protein
MLDLRGQLLRAALGFATCSMPSYGRALACWVGRGDYTLAGDPERRVAGGAIAKSGSFSDRKVAASMRARDSDAPQRPSFQVGTHRVSTFHMSNGRAELYGPGHLYVTRPARRIKRRRTYADPKERSPSTVTFTPGPVVTQTVTRTFCGPTDRGRFSQMKMDRLPSILNTPE